jgi:hypothetical protein
MEHISSTLSNISKPIKDKVHQPDIKTPKTINVNCWNCDNAMAIHDLSRIYYGVCGECGYAYVVLRK